MYGTDDWKVISKEMNFKSVRQYKERWFNYLSHYNIFRPWTEDEDQLLISRINSIGRKWVILAKYFPGRSENRVKNRWHSYLKKFERELLY